MHQSSIKPNFQLSVLLRPGRVASHQLAGPPLGSSGKRSTLFQSADRACPVSRSRSLNQALASLLILKLHPFSRRRPALERARQLDRPLADTKMLSIRLNCGATGDHSGASSARRRAETGPRDQTRGRNINGGRPAREPRQEALVSPAAFQVSGASAKSRRKPKQQLEVSLWALSRSSYGS